jgi:hypothetical protein
MTSGLRKFTAKRGSKVPRCLLIAGPNGAGKTTFAREYLPNDARVLNFINADLIAAGLSPLAPQQAAIAAARVMLAEIDRLSAEHLDFAFALWRTSGLCMTIRIVSQDSSNEVHERDQEAAHPSYKTDPEGSNSLQRGGPPHGQDVWHADIRMGERKGCRQEALIGFHVPQNIGTSLIR